MTALCGLFCFALWVPAQTYAVLLVFALAAGSVTGIFWGTVAPVTAEVVGLQRLPASFGMIVLPLVVPTVFAEPIALHLADKYGYLSAKVFVGCMFIAGAASTFALRSWKIADLEKKEARERDSAAAAIRTETANLSWLSVRKLLTNKRV